MIGLSNVNMQIPSGFEWVFIIIAIVIVFFGVKKIPEIARSFGRAKTEYEKSKIEAGRELIKYNLHIISTSILLNPVSFLSCPSTVDLQDMPLM